MSVTTGCIRCGIFLYCDSSTFLGSMRIILTSSGRLVIRIDRIIAFRQTDFARAGAAGHQQVRHVGEVEHQGRSLHVLAQDTGGSCSARVLDSTLAITSLSRTIDAAIVGDLDADRGLAGNRRHDPHARHGQGDGQVVGQAHDPRYPQAGLQLDLELGDDRAGVDLDDAHLVAEIEQRPLQQHGPGVDLGLVVLDRERRGGLEQLARGQLIGRTGLDGRHGCGASG